MGSIMVLNVFNYYGAVVGVGCSGGGCGSDGVLVQWAQVAGRCHFWSFYPIKLHIS